MKEIIGKCINNCMSNIIKLREKTRKQDVRKQLNRKKYLQTVKNYDVKNNLVVCPICKDKFGSLMMHIIYKHNLRVDEFKLKYKDCILQSPRVYKPIVCKFCNTIFYSPCGLAVHIKRFHKNEFIKNNTNNVIGFTCLICKRKTPNLSQHVELTHKISWDEYVNKTGYHGPKKWFSEDTKKILSENKLVYYKSPKGVEYKKIQSKKFLGNKNVACRPEVRKKISDNAIKRLKDGSNKFFDCGYGIRFDFEYNGVIYNVRSFEEFKCLWTLLINNIKFKYEPIQVAYNINGKVKNYLVDLIIDKKYIEIKGMYGNTLEKIKTCAKYNAIRTMFENLNKKFFIVNYNGLCEMFNIDKLSNDEIIVEIQKLLLDNKCKIKYTLFDWLYPRLLNKIDKHYLYNSNIIVKLKKGL